MEHFLLPLVRSRDRRPGSVSDQELFIHTGRDLGSGCSSLVGGLSESTLAKILGGHIFAQCGYLDKFSSRIPEPLWMFDVQDDEFVLMRY